MRSILLRRALSTLVLVVACAGSSPSGTVKQFYGYVAENKHEAVLTLLSAQSRSAFPADKLKVIVAEQSAKMKAAGGIKSVEVSDETITGEKAVLTAATTLGNGEQKSETWHLIRESGKWRISMQK